jgi:hypothetical protein
VEKKITNKYTLTSNAIAKEVPKDKGKEGSANDIS